MVSYAYRRWIPFMPGNGESLGKYISLSTNSEEELEASKVDDRRQNDARQSRGSFKVFGITSLLLLFIGGSLLAGFHHPDVDKPTAVSSACKKPAFRREWRSLSTSQKHNYLLAVQCLKQKPSRLGLNQSLYDDFPYVHYRVGGSSHGAAKFLSWHRYFLQTYHNTLHDECSYMGELTYWDWSLDWQDITKSPVWDANEGFGGDGNHSIGEDIVEGHCVVDGPFANFEIPFLDSEYHPHCLSRGFEKGDALLEHGRWFRPKAIEELLRNPDYEAFNLGLEDGPHIAIPRSIRGDFSLLTAPSDPVFFLHHTQLDRLWWRWQNVEPARHHRYTGKSAHGSNETASLDDIIMMGGLAPDIKVSDIISTEHNLLCYRY